MRLALRPGLVAAAVLAALGAAGAVAVYAVPLPAALGTPPSTVVAWRGGAPAHVFLAPDEQVRLEVHLAEVDPAYVRALLALEDARFPWHGGVDPLAIGRAAVTNLRRGRVVSGASTITMQLARLLEPRPRTLASKAVEALRAIQLEARLTKDEILEAYLERVPYGGNVQGIEAAALAYFGHSARALSADEIAILLAVPQDPNGRAPRPGHRRRLRAARDEIARRLLEVRALPEGPGGPEAVLARVGAAPVPEALRPFPRAVPHLARWLVARHPRRTRLVTTLDRGVQRLAEATLAGAAEGLAHQGIHNGAAVVLDHRRGEVLALVGGFDFFDAEHGGQIPAFDVARSPGSALKPFIYAMAIDAGLALPERLVPDIPVDYGGYAPKNYDGRFSGLVRLEDALSESLNVPLVNLLGEVGVDRFLGLLRAAGVEGLAGDASRYGLAAAIGAVELTPLDLALLYAGLAEDGRFRRPRILADAAAPPPVRLVSPGASWLTRRALARRDRPDFPQRRRVAGLPARIHWKTGTSYGHRDAWAVGSDAAHTAVVWTGNLDNAPSVDLVGALAAGPLLFDLLEGLSDPASGPPPDGPPGDLTPVEVCAYSGHPATGACPARRTVLARAASVPTAPCPYHVQVEVDPASGLAVNPSCRGDGPTRIERYVTWPASIRRWLGARHRWLPRPPSLAPGCRPGGVRAPPRILSPPAGKVALLLPGVPAGAQEIPLEADTALAGVTLSWFVDGAYLGSAPADRRLWWTPRPGVHEIVVSDGAGVTAHRRLEVRVRR